MSGRGRREKLAEMGTRDDKRPGLIRISWDIEQFRGLGDTGFARMHFGRAQFRAIHRTEPRSKILPQRFRAVRRDHAGRVQRAAESVRGPATAKRFEIGERDGPVAGYFVPGVKHRLGAVEPFRIFPKNFQGVFFHPIKAWAISRDCADRNARGCRR